MRRRLLVVSLSLMGLLLLALMAPLLTTYAADRTQDLFVSRLGDVTRFAVLAEDTLESGGAAGLDADLERYVEAYGGSVVVTNANREVVARAGGDDESTIRPVVGRALSGAGSLPPETAWPWGEDDMVIGSPVGRDAQVLGAVVLVAPTTSVQDSVAQGLAWLGLVGIGTLLLTAYGVVMPFLGWILRPVHDLDHAAKELALGDLSSRAHETGPPELRHLARSFNVMADNVETSQQQQRDLVADAAHQLGNPLTALRLRVENLTGSGAPVEAVEHALEETDRLSEIVDSLLRLSQVGARRIVPERIDVSALVQHRCDMWEPVFDKLTVQVGTSVEALGTPDLVDVTLDSLLDNAAKFAPGSPVWVTVTEEGADVVLRVRDRGPGLHPDDALKVGSRFFRGREHQNVPGTGLGLAIVMARLDDVGGSLEVTTPDEAGLQLEVRLPTVTRAAPGSSAAPPDARAGER